MQFTEHMSEMRILIDTIVISMRGLVWSAVLISGIVLASAILITQLSFVSLDDESIPLLRRKWLYQNFGTADRSCYTLFEMTFTGGWRFYTRVLFEEIGVGFAFFFVPYIVIVNFVVMRVVAALFLKHTLAVAQLDDEKKVTAKVEEKTLITDKIREFFAEADSSCNGAVSAEEFEVMLTNPNVAGYFADLGLKINEAVALFGVLGADDGEVDYQEFLEASIRVRQNVEVMDIVHLNHSHAKMSRTLSAVHDTVHLVHGHVQAAAAAAAPRTPRRGLECQ
jgi:hypothetical protein